jgi:hypothetical protein
LPESNPAAEAKLTVEQEKDLVRQVLNRQIQISELEKRGVNNKLIEAVRHGITSDPSGKYSQAFLTNKLQVYKLDKTYTFGNTS